MSYFYVCLSETKTKTKKKLSGSSSLASNAVDNVVGIRNTGALPR